MKKIITLSLCALALGSCTKHFEDINKNPYGVDEKILKTVPVGSTEIQDQNVWLALNQENGWQMTMDLVGVLSGFNAPTGFIDDYSAYSPRDGWNDYPYKDTYEHLYPSYNAIKAQTNGDYNDPIFAMSHISRVAITQRLTDMYGPLPYSKVDGVSTTVAYDSQRDLYLMMLDELKKASEALDAVPPAYSKYSEYDVLFGGRAQSWAKYARSLMLRMAVRMAKQEPALAKEYAEYAVSRGVIETNADNAKMPSSDNPMYKVSATWLDSRVSADIVEYMKAFKDPRTSAFFTNVGTRGAKPFGHRSGVAVNIKSNGMHANYSVPNISQNSSITMLNAAEVKFLKAEGALNGWSMGGTPEELYKEGIKASFEEWNVAFDDSYLQQTGKRSAFVDALLPEANAPTFKSDITVQWGEANGNKEKQLSKIITQKWIAMFPYNTMEAWTEWRRTGYPNLLPSLNNKSAGRVQDISQDDQGRDRGGMRRLRFASSDVRNNSQNVKQAIGFLGGSDTHGTDLWWAK